MSGVSVTVVPLLGLYIANIGAPEDGFDYLIDSNNLVLLDSEGNHLSVGELDE